MDWAMPAAYADISGVAAVPDGTVVELIRIDNTGSTVATLASGTTNNGRYNLEFDGSPSSDLVVQVRNTATNEVLRAFLTASTTDISVESDGAVALILNDIATDRANRPLANYTVDEISDLVGGLRTLTSSSSTAAGADINSSRAALVAAATGDAGINAFVGSLNADGRATAALGDIGDFFHLVQGTSIRYQGTQTTVQNSGAPVTVSYQNTATINGTATIGGTSTIRISNTNALNSGAGNEFLSLTQDGAKNFTDFASGALSTPIDLVNFPVRPGTSIRALQNQPGNLGGDLDGDGRIENGIFNSTVTVEGFTSKTVNGTQLNNLLTIRVNITVSGTLSRGGAYTSTIEQVEYRLANQGLVLLENTTSVSANGNTITATSKEEAVISGITTTSSTIGGAIGSPPASAVRS